MVIYIAVEHFVPVTGYGKSEALTMVVERALVQTRGDHDIAPDTWQPAMKCDDAIIVVYVKHVQAFAAQRWMLSSEPH